MIPSTLNHHTAFPIVLLYPSVLLLSHSLLPDLSSLFASFTFTLPSHYLLLLSFMSSLDPFLSPPPPLSPPFTSPSSVLGPHFPLPPIPSLFHTFPFPHLSLPSPSSFPLVPSFSSVPSLYTYLSLHPVVHLLIHSIIQRCSSYSTFLYPFYTLLSLPLPHPFSFPLYAFPLCNILYYSPSSFLLILFPFPLPSAKSLSSIMYL